MCGNAAVFGLFGGPGVVVGVYIAVGPVAEVKERDGDGGGIIVVVVGAFGIGCLVDKEVVAGSRATVAIFEHGRNGVFAVFGVGGSGRVDRFGCTTERTPSARTILPRRSFVGVVGVDCSLANIDEVGCNLGGVAVVGKANGAGGEVAEEGVLGRNLPEARGLDGPGHIRAHQAVLEFAVDGKLFRVRVGKAILFGAVKDKLCGLLKLRCGGHAMQGSEEAKVVVRGAAGDLRAKRRPLVWGEQGLLSDEGDREREERGESEAVEIAGHCAPSPSEPACKSRRPS